MKWFCMALVFVGAFIMGVSIRRYSRVLRDMKGQTYDVHTFDNWIYGVSFAMMLFFFFGYIGVAAWMAMAFDPGQLLVGFIFFFGACFVFCMVQVQRRMLITITNKTTETIESLVDAIEAKDPYTRGHSEHVSRLVELLYCHLPPEIRQSVNLNKLKDAAILHDIGKIGIPDHILNKPGKLTEEEWAIIRQHPQNGAAILEKTSYRELSSWVRYHHERLDGKGYYALTGEAIPFEARLIAIADTFSALNTDRVYRERYSCARAIEILHECAGTQLDPQLVEMFCAIPQEKICETSARNG